MSSPLGDFLRWLIVLVLLLLCGFGLARSSTQTVLVVCLDGLGEVNVTKETTPNLVRIGESGVRAKYMKPSNPTFTWPVLHSIMTGLYPEAHGIVSNVFYDPQYRDRFIFDYDCSNYDPKYYELAKPIWLTQQEQGGRSAVHFWPGYYSYNKKPTYYESPVCYVDCADVKDAELHKMRARTRPGWPPYIHAQPNYSEPIRARVDKVLDWLTSDSPPQFVALYSNEPDKAGHNHGASSTQYREAMKDMDSNMVAYLMKELRRADLLDKVNVLFVSDHGLADASSSRYVALEEYVDPDSFWMTSAGSSGHVWAPEDRAEEIYRNLSRADHPHMKVYKREDIPADWHWKHNRRIPPILIVPDVGWVVYKYRAKKAWSHGSHGWSADSPQMRAYFVATGPAFRKNFKADPFHVVDLYPLMCHLLGIEPQANNGSLSNVEAMLKEHFRVTKW